MTKFELEQCIKEYGRDIYSFCKQLTCNQQEADDLYQDTFLKAVEQLERLDRRDNPKSYLLSVAVHLWKNRRRKMAWRHRIAPSISFMEERDEDIVCEADESPEEKYFADEEKRLVQSDGRNRKKSTVSGKKVIRKRDRGSRSQRQM